MTEIMERRTSARVKAEDHIREAIRLIGEARRELTLWGFEAFIRDNIAALGGRGFIGSIGQVMVNSATIEQSAQDGTVTKRREV